MKTWLLALTIALVPAHLLAQSREMQKKVKKELSTARSNIKNGTNLESAESSMRSLLADTANVGDERIWLTLFAAIRKQYEQLNEKLYLSQESDTAKLFAHTLNMFYVLEGLDSVMSRLAVAPTPPRYRKEHGAYLHQYRKNLYGGGGYHLGKQDYKEAYEFFAAYMDCAVQPLFSDYNYSEADPRMADAAYWAVYCGYKLGKPDIVERYAAKALEDSTKEVYVLQYMADSYFVNGDSASYCSTLEAGFSKYPSNNYFFPHLVAYYADRAWDDKVLEICDVALAEDSCDVAALVCKSTALIHRGLYDECIATSDRALSLDSTLSVAYANAGLSYYNKSIPLSQKAKLTKDERARLTETYRKALPYLERFRRMMPEERNVWAMPLYTIYLNLNMGDEFEEMERIVGDM